MLRIRVLETRDISAVLQLANTYAAFDAPMSEADLATGQSYPDGSIVAEDDGRVVGFVLGYLREIPAAVLDHWKASIVGHVELLVVDPRSRNRGIGAALLKELLRAFKQAGADLVTLHCPAEAREAKRLYDKHSFGVRAYEMSKRL